MVLGAGALTMVCQHLSSGLVMFLCVSGTCPKMYLVHGALIEAEILTSPLCHVICSTWPRFWVLVL